MPADIALNALRGEPGPPPVGVTWVPSEALEAMFFGAASGPAEALGAFCREVPLDFAFVPAEEEWAAEAVAAVRAADALPVWAVAGPLGRVGESLGWVEALRLTAAAPAQVAFALDEALHEALQDVRRGARAGAGAIALADDLAGASGPIVSPDYALEVLVPLYARLARVAAAEGLPAVFHSDGDTRALVPAIARAGFSAVHPGGLYDDSLEAYRSAASANGLALVGGLAATRVRAGSHDSALAAVDFAAVGGVLIADDGSIASPEALAAFVTTVRAVLKLTGRGAAGR